MCLFLNLHPPHNQTHSYHIDVDALPIVAVVDPRTGGKVSQWGGSVRTCLYLCG